MGDVNESAWTLFLNVILGALADPLKPYGPRFEIPCSLRQSLSQFTGLQESVIKGVSEFRG